MEYKGNVESVVREMSVSRPCNVNIRAVSWKESCWWELFIANSKFEAISVQYCRSPYFIRLKTLLLIKSYLLECVYGATVAVMSKMG